MRFVSIRYPQGALVMRMQEIILVRTSWRVDACKFCYGAKVACESETYPLTVSILRALFTLQKPRRRNSMVTRSEAVKATR